RQQLLADALGDRIEPGAGTAGEDDAFASCHLGFLESPARVRAGSLRGSRSGGRADAFEPVAAVQHPLHPVLIVQVPVHGGGYALLEAVPGLPAQFVLQLGGVDRIAAVVAGTVGDEGDQALARLAVGSRAALV